MTSTNDHEPEPWFWEAGSEHCPHGPQPDYDTQPEAWDDWQERHPGSPQDVRICLDAPMGDRCAECSADHNEPISWSACRIRERVRPVQPAAEPQHRPITVTGGNLECLERECEEFFTDDGDEIPGKETCSHLSEMEICEACSEPPAGGLDSFPAVVAWADCAQNLAKAGAQR